MKIVPTRERNYDIFPYNNTCIIHKQNHSTQHPVQNKCVKASTLFTQLKKPKFLQEENGGMNPHKLKYLINFWYTWITNILCWLLKWRLLQNVKIICQELWPLLCLHTYTVSKKYWNTSIHLECIILFINSLSYDTSLKRST